MDLFVALFVALFVFRGGVLGRGLSSNEGL